MYTGMHKNFFFVLFFSVFQILDLKKNPKQITPADESFYTVLNRKVIYFSPVVYLWTCRTSENFKHSVWVLVKTFNQNWGDIVVLTLISVRICFLDKGMSCKFKDLQKCPTKSFYMFIFQWCAVWPTWRKINNRIYNNI